jgi:hypothetical protein
VDRAALDGDGVSGEPTSARLAAAEAALIEAWPDLAHDPVYVEQLAAVALNAAYNPAWHRPVVAYEREPDEPGQDAPPLPAGVEGHHLGGR